MKDSGPSLALTTHSRMAAASQPRISVAGLHRLVKGAYAEACPRRIGARLQQKRNRRNHAPDYAEQERSEIFRPMASTSALNSPRLES
jgi:hypothetical protein